MRILYSASLDFKDRLTVKEGMPDAPILAPVTPLMIAYLATQKMPDEARRSEGVQAMLRGFSRVAEKDLAWALRLARSAGVSLPVGGLVSQLTDRLYGVEDGDRS